MKQLLITASLFFLTLGIHAQKQFSLDIDTTKTVILGFNQKTKQLSLSSKKSADLKYPALAFREPKNIKNVIAHNASTWNMPVYKSKSNHTMPIHIPDSTITYSLEIVQPKKD